MPSENQLSINIFYIIIVNDTDGWHHDTDVPITFKLQNTESKQPKS